MHIGLAIPSLKRGGAERMVLNLAQGLIDRGHRVDIVMFRPLFHYADEVPAAARLFAAENVAARYPKETAARPGARLEYLPAPASGLGWFDMARRFDWDLYRCRPDLNLLRWARAIASYVERENPDCVLPSLPRAKAAALVAGSMVSGQPRIVPIVHSNYDYRNATARHRLRRLAGHAAHFVGVSQGASERLAAVVGVPRERVTTIYNPVVTPTLHDRMTERPAHPWLLDRSVPVIMAAGRLEKPKDFPTLVRAFARLAARRSCRLVVLGEGRERETLEGLAAELGVAHRVSLPGWADNPFAYMSRAALLVVSSIHEGLGMVLVEALACGCPCVSTDCPAGPSEVLQDGGLGPLVAVGDEAGLAEAMERVLDRPPDKRMLRRRAAAFSVDAAASAYEGLIGTLARASGPRRGRDTDTEGSDGGSPPPDERFGERPGRVASERGPA